EQSMDQELTRSNLALALTMNQPINKNGAVAEDWKKSSPVRVVRSYKLAKESKFLPPLKASAMMNGFLVWRYEFRRDDPEPAPWTKKGKARIEQLGLTMYCPEGYVVPNAKSEMDKAKAKGKKGSGRSRKEEEEAEAPTNKKAKAVAKIFKPHAETLKLIAQDLLNARTWQLILEQEYPSETAFLEAI
ncbi:ubiquitin-like with PHD and RING finger domains 2, partial [Massospora cicadina]